MLSYKPRPPGPHQSTSISITSLYLLHHHLSCSSPHHIQTLVIPDETLPNSGELPNPHLPPRKLGETLPKSDETPSQNPPPELGEPLQSLENPPQSLVKPCRMQLRQPTRFDRKRGGQARNAISLRGNRECSCESVGANPKKIYRWGRLRASYFW